MDRNCEAEQSVIGSILIDERCFPAVRQLVQTDDFAIEQDRNIFLSACCLADSGGRVDPVTVLDEMKKRGVYDEQHSYDYIYQLMEITPTAANAVAYAKIVHKKGALRRLRKVGNLISERSSDDSADPAQVLADALADLKDADEDVGEAATVGSSSALESFLDYRARLEQGGSETAAIPTGYSSLDTRLGGGLLREGLYILAARPGVGKTTLGLKIAEHAAGKGPVLFLSLEMSINQITARRIADATGLPITRLLMSSHLTDEEQGRVCMAASDLSQRPLILNRKLDASVSEISAISHGIDGLRLVVVDYLGLIRPKNPRASLYERVTQTSGDLKALARSLGIPVLCLAQLNRQSEQRTDKLPCLADLRDSGAIEQDADAVMLLHRPCLYQQSKPSPFEPEELQVNVAKNRHGATGKISLSLYSVNGRVTT
jgi:replicative DNA helicase